MTNQFHRASHHVADDPASALEAAEAICRSRGLRLTPMRRAVLEQLLSAGHPLGAYDLIQRLGAVRNTPLAPPAIYRSLDFLLANGLAHKLETSRTYVACVHPDHAHTAQFLICRRCGTVVEIGDEELSAAALALGERTGFVVEQQAVELTGVCAGCAC